VRNVEIVNRSNKSFHMEIDKNIIAETVKCEKNFDCLNMNKHVYCKVENCINEKVHFIKGVDNLSYKMSFGDSFFCTCPTRKEIFNKYRL
jgi:hypothetical protein